MNKSSRETCRGRFAFLIHPPSIEDLYESGPSSFSRFTPGQRRNWESWIASWSARRYEPGVAYHLPALHSRAGGYVEGWLVAIPLTPSQMMRLKPQDRADLLGRCVEIAKELEVDMLGLGAFTSIVSRGGSDLVGCGVNVTTGNSLTAMAAAEGLRIAARARGKDLARERAGVIGAAGSVGRLACRRLAHECRDITLFGNPSNPGSLQKLKVLAGELCQDGIERARNGVASGISGPLSRFLAAIEDAYFASVRERSARTLAALHDAVAGHAHHAGVEAPVRLTVDLARELPRMGFVLSATSQGKAFIDADLLAHGAIVCDAARPADVVAGIRDARADLLVYEGGLMRLPQAVSFGRRNVVGCEPGINLACLSETMVVTMSGIRRDVSVGAEPSFADAEEIYRLARHHGFEVFVPDAGRVEALATAA